MCARVCVCVCVYACACVRARVRLRVYVRVRVRACVSGSIAMKNLALLVASVRAESDVVGGHPHARAFGIAAGMIEQVARARIHARPHQQAGRH